jgi:hypothetical protein
MTAKPAEEARTFPVTTKTDPTARAVNPATTSWNRALFRNSVILFLHEA